jgi:adenylate kinase family enzyme
MSVLVTGASGAGTTTLGRALAQHWEVPHVDVDDYFWTDADPPFTVKRSATERVALLSAFLQQHPLSVLSGSVMDWSPDLEDGFEAVIFLYVETSARLRRLEHREIERNGQVNQAFLDWASQYDQGTREGRSLRRHETWLAARSCPVIRICGDHPLASLIARVVSELPNPGFERSRR